MTIVRPNENRDVRRLALLCCVVVGGMLVAVLLSYINLVNIRHDLSDMRTSLESMKVSNAELKNHYYQIISIENLEKFAGEAGLVQDKSPEWVLASQS